MKKIRQTIKQITTDILNNKLLIICNKYKIEYDIINGSVDFNCVDDTNNIIGINGINKDDDIIIFFKNKNDDIIKPIKIIKILNYTFQSDSSECYSSEYNSNEYNTDF